MIYSILISVAIFFFGSIIAHTQNGDETQKSEFIVYGNCDMCEARIEKAAKIDGVKSADWDQSTKMLTVEYDTEIVELKKIHESIAAVGHDTELAKASDSVYAKLHKCCKYDRPE
ncbi:MAG: heavy-metal-associated domain-containing protein [Desulfobulbaceae bacterium]|nr:heavy-metal-associated domain-containing protein [Candidatus Kapabacteria bacterium]MBS3999999.1 heavy-metal-associated domain-containing protein [Desulfobulbaceae bacterium]